MSNLNSQVFLEDVSDESVQSTANGIDTINKRYVIYPIQHKPLWNLYEKALASFWTAKEIDLTKDTNDWKTLDKNEQYFIKHIIAFFAASDGIVNDNLALRFINEVQEQEAKFFYGFQIAMENIHSETYSILIDTYIRDPDEKSYLFNAVNNIPCINKKAHWAIKWIESEDTSLLMRLVAFACVEGIFFSGAFCSIFWLKKRGLMPGLTFSNELISRDEALHCEFAITLYNYLGGGIPESTIHKIVKEAVEIEEEFIIDSLPCNLLGMNSDLMRQYIQYVADRLCLQLGYSKIYNVKQPFEFMELISIEGKTNFFEKRNSEYNVDTFDRKIGFDEDF